MTHQSVLVVEHVNQLEDAEAYAQVLDVIPLAIVRRNVIRWPMDLLLQSIANVKPNLELPATIQLCLLVAVRWDDEVVHDHSLLAQLLAIRVVNYIQLV